MQHLQPNTTLQGGKYRIERVLGQECFSCIKLFLLTIVITLIPSLLMAQAAGGNIRRPTIGIHRHNNQKPNHKNSTSSHSDNIHFIQTKTQNGINCSLDGYEFNMVRIDGGAFTMGATSEQGRDAESDENPIHNVVLSSYYMGETEVTQRLWEIVMGSNPSYFKGSKRPVEMVSWNDCMVFMRKLNHLTGLNFRFPTEAEWEFAARGGKGNSRYKYVGSNVITSVAWYDGNSAHQTHEVGTKSPNELGLYDMSGNVWEWCQDWYVDSYLDGKPQRNPNGPSTGSERVVRGGSWNCEIKNCRVSFRDYDSPTIRENDMGFRLAL